MTKTIMQVLNNNNEIYSQIIDNTNFLEIIATIVEVYEKSDIKLKKLSMYDELYFALKSYRSNVTEGNTTTVGEFTEIIQGNKEEITGQTQDNLLEIENLWKAYIYINKLEINEKTMLSCHRILGTNILKNNLMQSRGKYKKNNNLVTFSYENNRYIKQFRRKETVKKDIQNLLQIIGSFDTNSEAEIFAKYLIIHTEIISIHPFEDGNGRISRLLAETYLERCGFHPYSPYSEGAKKEYQNAMGKFSVISTESISEGYRYLAQYILAEYEDNINSFIESYKNFAKKMK